jgi:hypothetical protein
MGKNSASFQCLVLLKTASMEAALASVLVHGVTRENPVLDQSFNETAPKILRFFLLSNLGFSYMLFISMAFPSELTAFFTSLVNLNF